MTMYHHGTMRKYTAALLDLFNGIEVQQNDSNGNTITKSIPIVYSSIEKAKLFDQYTNEQMMSGNYNKLPRASLSLSTIVKADGRVANKNVKINTYASEKQFEYMYNSVPYEFTYELNIQCRGMNEASQIIEQIAPKFNPTVNIDIWDASNLDEPTRVPVKMLDISFENEEYGDTSSNIVTLSIGISLMGNLYPPIRTVERVRDFKMYINQTDGQYFDKKAIMGWDVNDKGALENETLVEVLDNHTYAPNIIDIVSTGVIGVGVNNISVIYDDKDNKITELNFAWTVLQGSGIVTGDLDRAQLQITGTGDVEVEVTITDPFGNYRSLSKIFTV